MRLKVRFVDVELALDEKEEAEAGAGADQVVDELRDFLRENRGPVKAFLAALAGLVDQVEDEEEEEPDHTVDPTIKLGEAVTVARYADGDVREVALGFIVSDWSTPADPTRVDVVAWLDAVGCHLLKEIALDERSARQARGDGWSWLPIPPAHRVVKLVDGQPVPLRGGVVEVVDVRAGLKVGGVSPAIVQSVDLSKPRVATLVVHDGGDTVHRFEAVPFLGDVDGTFNGEAWRVRA